MSQDPDPSPTRRLNPDRATEPTRPGQPEGISVPLVLPPRFGPYDVVREVGHGGMGFVFEVLHRERRRHEALKVLRPELGGDPDVAERFRREVRALSNIDHPHVVTLFDAGVVDGRLYYTMRLLSGVSLADVIRAVRATGEKVPGPKANGVLDAHGLPPASAGEPGSPLAYVRRVAAAVAPVADALAVLHRANLLHRDLKPSNLMLDDRGRVLLADFGLVRTDEGRITTTGEMLGTPSYMSPEQVVPGEGDVDQRADIYGLGATLYELFTLRLPHEGATLPETIELIRHESPAPVRSLNPELPADAQTIVSRAMERRREDRYADADAVREDLDALARGEPIRTRPVGPGRRALNVLRARRRPLIALLLVLAGVLGWAVTRPSYLTIRTTPTVDVLLDRAAVGSTPIASRRISSGGHEVVLRHERFHDVERRFTVSRGDTYTLDVFMPAKDPADPEVLRLMAAARGLDPSQVDVPRMRGPTGPDVVAFPPRGPTLRMPQALRLWAIGEVDGHVARLEEGGGDGSAIHTWSVPAATGDLDLEIPLSIQRLLEPERSYRLRVIDANGRTISVSTFEVVSPEDAQLVERRLEELAHGFEPNDQVVGFLRGEALLQAGFSGAAYAEAEALQRALGDRAEIARLALAALDDAGLREEGPWFRWATAFHGAER